MPRVAAAEFVCSSEIVYSWQRQDSGDDSATAAPVETSAPRAPIKGPAGKGSPVPPTPSPSLETPPSSATPSLVQVRVASVERAGRDEAAAKTALLVEVNRQKARASERCKQEHESFGECLATKLSAKASVLNSLSFSTRAQLEKALTNECQTQQGLCLGVESSEPVCREIAAAGADAGQAGKDKAPDAAGKPAAQPKGAPKKK